MVTEAAGSVSAISERFHTSTAPLDLSWQPIPVTVEGTVTDLRPLPLGADLFCCFSCPNMPIGRNGLHSALSQKTPETDKGISMDSAGDRRLMFVCHSLQSSSSQFHCFYCTSIVQAQHYIFRASHIHQVQRKLRLSDMHDLEPTIILRCIWILN